MRGMADKAWAAGWNVVRLNQRNCGGTEQLSRGLYHSGLTHDPLFVMRELIDADGLPAIAVAGYSLGGNVALKLAGELGDEAPPQLMAVCAVSPTMDLAVCVDALERRANYPYQWNFVRNLKARMRRKAALFPGDFSVEPLGRIWTVRAVRRGLHGAVLRLRRTPPTTTTAPARMRAIDRIRVPTLILTAENDPFVPPDPFRDPDRRRQPAHHHRRDAATAATARSWSRPTGATTGIGPSARWSGLRRRRGQMRELHQRLPELRTFPCLFVLEVDEHVVAA